MKNVVYYEEEAFRKSKEAKSYDVNGGGSKKMSFGFFRGFWGSKKSAKEVEGLKRVYGVEGVKGVEGV